MNNSYIDNYSGNSGYFPYPSSMRSAFSAVPRPVTTPSPVTPPNHISGYTGGWHHAIISVSILCFFIDILA